MMIGDWPGAIVSAWESLARAHRGLEVLASAFPGDDPRATARRIRQLRRGFIRDFGGPWSRHGRKTLRKLRAQKRGPWGKS